ncbi:DUF4279 domain-containing protein [Nonlabens sp. Asnod3-A02]|uniref:DUF4279 domain-containing protein n=1 Tax=Nonlabens sp. Asnod3-A02 TaxID=3160579 RepID=UPI00386653D7
MNESSNTYVYFSLIGDDFDTNELTERLGIKPTESRNKGDKGNYNSSLRFSCWKISTEKGKEYYNVYKLIEEIVEILYSKIDIIIMLKDEYQLDSVLQIVLDIDINPNQSTPALGYDLKTIDFLHQTKTTIDVDIYRFNSLE